MGGKKKFPRISGCVMPNFVWVSSTMPKFRKINDTIQRKPLARWKDRRKATETLFYRTLPATVGGPKMIKVKQLRADLWCNIIFWRIHNNCLYFKRWFNLDFNVSIFKKLGYSPSWRKYFLWHILPWMMSINESFQFKKVKHNITEYHTIRITWKLPL